jgi:hypothetical protein
MSKEASYLPPAVVASGGTLAVVWPCVDVYRKVNGPFSHTAKLENRLCLVRPI